MGDYTGPVEKEFEIYELIGGNLSANNRQLLCETSIGKVAFLGSEKNMINITIVKDLTNFPQKVRCKCVPASFSVATWWVIEKLRIELID